MLKKVMGNNVLAAAALSLTATTANAGAIDFRLGSDMAELSYLSQNASFGYGGADIGFGALVNDDNDFFGNASILVSGSSAGEVKGLHFGVGAKLYAGTLDHPVENINGGSMALGGRIRYVVPGTVPLAVLAEGFYAPDITSISEFDGLFEYRFALEFEVTPSARAYVGYRRLQIEHDKGSAKTIEYDVDKDFHVGVRFEF